MSLVNFEIKKHVGIITLNDPERLNAMSEKMAKEFAVLIKKIKKEKNLRALILTGFGKSFFSWWQSRYAH